VIAPISSFSLEASERSYAIAGDHAKICKRGTNWDGRPIGSLVPKNLDLDGLMGSLDHAEPLCGLRMDQLV